MPKYLLLQISDNKSQNMLPVYIDKNNDYWHFQIHTTDSKIKPLSDYIRFSYSKFIDKINNSKIPVNFVIKRIEGFSKKEQFGLLHYLPILDVIYKLKNINSIYFEEEILKTFLKTNKILEKFSCKSKINRIFIGYNKNKVISKHSYAYPYAYLYYTILKNKHFLRNVNLKVFIGMIYSHNDFSIYSIENLNNEEYILYALSKCKKLNNITLSYNSFSDRQSEKITSHISNIIKNNHRLENFVFLNTKFSKVEIKYKSYNNILPAYIFKNNLIESLSKIKEIPTKKKLRFRINI